MPAKSVGNYTISVNGDDPHWGIVSVTSRFNCNLDIKISKRYRSWENAIASFNRFKTTEDVESFLRCECDLYAKFKNHGAT